MAIPFERLEGKYEILEKMREGGMGALYKVRHRLLEEMRVIKVMRPHLADDEVLKARFLREAKTAIRLRHPNLAQIYDFTVDEEGGFFLVMEFINGLNLQELARVVQPVPIGLCLEIASQTLGVLGYLHRKEIVHRDISPDNILVTRDDEGQTQIKLIDLGIAKVQQSDDNLTATGTFLGKVRYSSPESFRTKDSEDVGPHSDIYSMGIVLYELLTGRYPIRGSTISSLIAGHLMHEPLPFADSDPDERIPPKLRDAVVRALAKEPEERFPSARAFRGALHEIRQDFPVDHHELSAILDSPDIPTLRMPVVKPGSTQSHLDRNFGLSTTPAPPAGSASEELESDQTVQTPPELPTSEEATAAPDPPAAAPKHQVRALLLGAEKLVQAHHYDEARLQLQATLEIAPDNPEALKLLAALDAADSKLRERREKAAAGVEKLLEQRVFEKASNELEQAAQRLGECELFSSLRLRLEQEEDAARELAETMEALASSAADHIAEEDFETALTTLDELATHEPAHPRLQELRAQAEEGLQRAKETARRQREIDRTVKAISDHLAANDLQEAIRSLAIARKLYPGEEALDPLDKQVEKLSDEHRKRQGEVLVAAAEAEIEGRRFEDALATLETARGVIPGDPRLADLTQRAEEGIRAREEEARRQQALAEVAAGVERLILAGRFETALERIDLGEKEHGPFAAADQIRARIEGQKKARASCREQLEAAFKNMEKALEQTAFDEAEEILQRARKTVAEHPELVHLVDEADERFRLLSDNARRRMAIEEAAASIRTRLDEGAFDEAEREIEVAQRVYGREQLFQDFKRQVEDRRRAEREAEVEKLLHEALGRRTSFNDAINKLERALTLTPDSEKVQRLLSELRCAQQRLRAEKAAQAMTGALAEIDELIMQDRIDDALAALDRAVAEHGDSPTAQGLKLRLRQTRRAPPD